MRWHAHFQPQLMLCACIASFSSHNHKPHSLPLQDGGKFRVSRKAVLIADGLIPAPGSGAGAAAASSGSDGEAAELPEIGRIYRGCKITGIAQFGAFVDLGVR